MKNTLKRSRKQNKKERTARGPVPGIPRRTIGVDLGFERSAYCVLNQAREVVEEEWMLTTRETLRARWGGEEEMGRVVMEACGLSTWVREEFVALGYEVSLSERNGMAAARVSVSG